MYFTVKWVAENGAEHIWFAKNVSYTPGQAATDQEVAKPAAVSFSQPDGDAQCTIDSGQVYVMNDAGRTVADYVLRTKSWPHGLAPRQAA